MDKKRVFQMLLQRVDEMISQAEVGRKQAQFEANQHGGAMESRYDTFKEEAQYLAGAQAKRTFELQETRVQIKKLLDDTSVFLPAFTVRVTSLVTLKDEYQDTLIYLISPFMGGEKITIGKSQAVLLSTTSPIGRQLIGKAVDDEVFITVQGVERELIITEIQ